MNARVRFPGESAAYREARTALLEQEIALREKVEQVAAARRRLPLGGALKHAYVFTHSAGETSFDALFGGHDALLLYNFMYAPGGAACPMCTAFLDGLNGNAAYIRERAALAVLAKAAPAELETWAQARNWHNLRMLSCGGGSSFNADYHAESEDGAQRAMLHVFVKNAHGIFHYWSSELFFAPFAAGNVRLVDQLWPLWNAFDLLPQGRGVDWWPAPHMQQPASI